MADWHVARKDEAPDTNEECWTDAVEVVAAEFANDTGALGEMVQAVAAADDVLRWISNAVEVPQHHIHALRDLVKLAADVRKDVELEMTDYRRNQR